MTLQKAIFRTCLIFCFYLQFTVLQAQSEQIPLLEREVSISARNQTIEWVISEISTQSGIIFSYNPEIIGADSKIDLSVQSKSVRFALNSLFTNNITYKERGEYII
ncbi:MAG TPA: hypothetical protein VHO50_12880, partial [Bacteroidales bacterium]|nr:hypothetical protein [Bacteroidales bacterium]